MSNLMKRVFRPSVSYEDKISYMTSLEVNHSVSSGNSSNSAACSEAIFNLLSSQNTRYMGLQLLEIALLQDPDKFYHCGKWSVIIFQIIKDSHTENLEKTLALKILSMVIPYIANDTTTNSKDELIGDVYPFLLEKVQENVEWTEEVCQCVKMCLKTFPSHLHMYQNLLLKVILHQVSFNVSSKSFEVLAECFCEIPYCTKDNNADTIKACWMDLYKRTLKTIECLLLECLSCANSYEDSYEMIEIEASVFNFENSPESDFFTVFMIKYRRFVNLCKCLAKLLSVKPRYPVIVPVRLTFNCFVKLYTACKKEKVDDPNEEILYTFIAQMQLAGLVVIESLVLNSNLLKYSVEMKDFIGIVLKSSKTIFSSEPVRELRIATWKLLHLWLEALGRGASKEIAQAFDLIQELLKDINIDTSESLQVNNAMNNKSKKNTGLNSNSRNVLMRKNQLKVCETALNALESFLYTGTLDFSKGVFQELCNRIFKICHTIHSDPFPFPYNDELCRRKLYSVVLAIALVLKPDEVQCLQTAIIILARMSNDPSFKVRKFSNKATVIYRLQLYPKRQIPVCCFDSKPRRPNVSDERLKYADWSSDQYVPNLTIENGPGPSGNVNMDVNHEVEAHSGDFMDVETHYPEQVIENQCNGDEDVLEAQSVSQCQDDEESDEEEEEEDDERGYGEEEMNQDEHESYVPGSRKVQISSAVEISSENIESINEPEYEELTTCVKVEENALSSSTKDKCINGDDIVIQDKDLPSSSAQQMIANENGMFDVDDDDDLEEENEDEEEEESEIHHIEKKIEHFEPPLKKQKVENKDDRDNDERQEKSRSPTLEEMKANFLEILPSEEDVRSGKVQLSSS